MAHITGNDLIIAIEGSGGGGLHAIAGSKSCDIETSCELKEISSPTSSEYRTYTPGRKNWKVTVNFLVATSSIGVLTMKNVGQSYTLKAYIRDGAAIDYFQGTAILQQAKTTGTRGNLLQGSWVFQGSGDI